MVKLDTMDQIVGYIERITYQNTENGYCVARLKEPQKQELTTIVGTIPDIRSGETLTCQGFWKLNKTHGYQFEVQLYEATQPRDLSGIERYLCSGMIKGIGTVMAHRIIEKFGIDTLQVINDDPDKLLEISGIGKARVAMIQQCWEDQKVIREVMIYLQKFAINPGLAQRIFKHYGPTSIAVLEANPYQLARDIHGIGFKTADKIARAMGCAIDNPQRVDSGIEYVLSELAENGHTCYPVTAFVLEAERLLGVDMAIIQQRLDTLRFDQRIFTDTITLNQGPAEAVWLAPFYYCEIGIARELQRLTSAPSRLTIGHVGQSMQAAQDALRLILGAGQADAVRQALNEKVFIITGGPGTGKSTITRVILAVMTKLTAKIMLAAPTGRAAKRMSEITGFAAQTIHALLKFNFGAHQFAQNAKNPLDVDFMIVDEASMIDTSLMYNLLKALPDHTRLLIIGDIHQLPSVGPGQVLSDIMATGLIPMATLTEIFRQAAGSAIITNAHRINAGLMPDLKVNRTSDFFFISNDNPEAIVTEIKSLVTTRLPNAYDLDPLTDIQVMAPMKKGIIGTINLNAELQSALNTETTHFSRMGRRFFIGDKVIQLKNDYEREVFNGDIGFIRTMNLEDQTFSVSFDEREVAYDFSDADELDLAYAISIHKFQGSECPCVVMPVHTTHYMMLGRNLLYTGVTRGKKLVVLIGMPKALAIGVKSNRTHLRYTGLRSFIKPENHIGNF